MLTTKGKNLWEHVAVHSQSCAGESPGKGLVEFKFGFFFCIHATALVGPLPC